MIHPCGHSEPSATRTRLTAPRCQANLHRVPDPVYVAHLGHPGAEPPSDSEGNLVSDETSHAGDGCFQRMAHWQAEDSRGGKGHSLGELVEGPLKKGWG